MPAINALLPIVATSNAQKESTQARADESRASALKSAAGAVSKGLEQEAAAEKRMQQKRFINAYEEGIQEQGREQERRAQRVAADEHAQRDEAAALATSGNALPPVGEALPTLGVTGQSAPNAAIDTAETVKPTKPLESPAPSVPVVQASDPTEQPVVAPPIATSTPSVEQQQQAAEAFHALVSTQNGKAHEKGILQQAMSASDQQLIASTSPEQASTTMLASVQQDATNTLQLGEEGPVALRLVGQSAAAPVDTDSLLGGAEPEQAQLVRAWRGLDTQQLRSPTAAATPTAQTAQAVRHDPVAASVPISFSGQIQQFAQSLRLATGQPDAAVSATSAERGAASASLTSAELSPWRTDSAAANSAANGGRAVAASTGFAQTMQASNFGQPLGQAVGQNAWGESIAQRVSLMAGLKISSAQIQLDPPELGAMTVKVSVNGDQASVSFHSPHAMVRDALELSFPRLQEMMGQQGMQLIDAQVSDNSSAKQGSDESASGRAGQAPGEANDENSSNASAHIVQIAKGLIDFYA